MVKEILFYLFVIGFYLMSIWQYRNPVKSVQLFNKKMFLEEPKLNKEVFRNMIILRGFVFTFFFILIFFNFFFRNR